MSVRFQCSLLVAAAAAAARTTSTLPRNLPSPSSNLGRSKTKGIPSAYDKVNQRNDGRTIDMNALASDLFSSQTRTILCHSYKSTTVNANKLSRH